MHTDTQGPSVPIVANHVVCLLDLLGQSDRLSGWAQMPDDGQLTPAFLDAIRSTVGTVNSLSDMFRQFFDEYTRPHLTPKQQGSLNQEQLNLYARTKSYYLGKQQFADTFVFYSPLRNPEGDVTVGALLCTLIACSMAMLGAFANKIPVRGAICIGPGIELAPGTFYGPALARAHHLESRCAAYPRVLVDDGVVKFLESSGFSSHAIIDNIMVSLRELALSMICPDEDGLLMVDYMGEKVRWLTSENPNIAHLVIEAHRFVGTETARFRDQGPDKLAKRYSNVFRYMNSQISLWQS